MGKSVVIIGGGLGGLFSGAILSKEGMKVTVIEKNVIIGGGLQSFSRFGVVFDTGMHIIGGMQKDGNIRRICEYLGIMDRVHVKDVDPCNMDTLFFDEDKNTYRIVQGRNKYVQALAERFPHQRKNLEEYMDAVYRIADEVDLFYLRPSTDYLPVHSDEFCMAADEFIAKYISDEHLRSIVAYNNPLYGGRRGVTPAYIHALISVLYIDGSSRFAGGSILFAETLRDYIAGHGGEVIAGDAVTAVHSEEKHVTGVTTASGREFSADYYICAIHPCTFFSLLDDPRLLPKPYRDRLNDLPNAYSAFTLNIKLKPGRFRFMNHTMYYMTRYDAIWDFGESEKWPFGFLFITPPELEQGEYARKIIVTAPMLWKFVRQWEDSKVGARGPGYAEWKQSCTEKLLDGIEKIFPGFRDGIEAINSASPLTIRDFYGVKEGSMYGFSKDCNNLVLSQVPVVTKASNLFMTGQNCNLHGFCGVSLTAISTCEAILGRNYVLDKINRFSDIRPYLEYEIPSAMRRIAAHPLFRTVADFIFPGEDTERIRRTVAGIDTVAEFQEKVMTPAVRTVLDRSCSGFHYEGLENLDRSHPCLFVSNHRDIALDATLLSYAIHENGFDSPEISFGANLMQGDFVVDFGKVNKMYRVERPGGDLVEFHKASMHLSDYIRSTIRERGQSVWIAQRNGRTKDGADRTDRAIVKMFAMSCPEDRVEAIAGLNIVPVAISYEWEPCCALKAVELYRRARGPYEKAEGEDLHSIVSGILQQKGRVSIKICERITASDLAPFAHLSGNAYYRKVAELIDRRICGAYVLSANNYIACDLLSGKDAFRDKYSEAEKTRFLEYLDGILREASGCGREEITRIVLGIYANPVNSKQSFEI